MKQLKRPTPFNVLIQHRRPVP